MDIKLYLGDCLEIMPTLPAGSIDAIITDIPYGTTACSWDEVLPFDRMWAGVKHVLKPRGVFITTASQPFTSMLVMSNLDWFRYEWVWEKTKPTGFLDANKKPLKAHENICMFSHNGHTYNPQMVIGQKHLRGGGPKPTGVYGDFSNRKTTESEEYYPRSVVQFSFEYSPQHPTQKPVALYEYLIKTYTNEGETVLDITMGSGTTMVACVNTGRNGIGIELKPEYYEIAQRRVTEIEMQERMPI